MALTFDSALKRYTVSFPVAHPVLEHEGGGRGIADRAAVGAAVGERIDAVVRVQRLFEKMDNPPALEIVEVNLTA